MINEATIGVVSAALGGLIVKIFDYFSNRSQLKYDVATEIREELREDMAVFEQERDRARAELVVWKTKYYNLLKEKNDILLRLSALESRMKDIK